jgi:cell wall-associated NlpC family hydrolase
MTYLGTPYSWAAGNASGPTYGVSEPGAAWNDSKILGFDCSALMLYAWAPWLSMDHNAARQYWQAGRYHPSINNLMPGDLIFWSANGTIGSIDHVAMNIGGGDVIQAPQSGDVIKITNVYDVEAGYFGATRPLT